MTTSNQKKQVEVVIAGKVYRLAGSESEEYIQSVAHYINKKLIELSKHTSAGVEFTETYPILLALNIADDLFKERSKGKEESASVPAEALTDLSDLSNQLVDRAHEIEQLNSTIEEKDNAIAKYKTAMQQGSIQFENFKKAIAERDSEITALRNKLAAANTEITKLTAKASDTSIEIGELNKKINAKNKELNALSVKLAEKNNALNELNKKSAERNQKLNKVNKERDELAVKLKEANAAIALLTGQINDNKKTSDGAKETLGKTIDELNSRIAKLTEENDALSDKLDRLNSDYIGLKENIPQGDAATLQNALNAVKAENRRLYNDNEMLVQELNKAKSEIKSFIDSLK